MTTSRSDAGDICDPADLPLEISAAGPARPPGPPGLLRTLDLAAVLRWAHGAVAVLDRARPVLDRANVFPVPDADTGTNLAATLRAARDAAVASAAVADPSAERALHAFARGALVGARGSSGVILSEFLRGLAGAGPCSTGAGADGLARALDRGARRAVAAVVDPRPGTMLTAARGAADAALEASAAGGDLLQTVESARTGAADALRRSVEELDVLRQAGVLDAGAYGFVLLLDALGAALRPDPVGSPTADDPLSVGHGTIVLMDSLTVAPARAPGGQDAWSVLVDDGDGATRHPHHPPHPHRGRETSEDHRDHRDHRHHGDHSAVDGEFELMCVVRHAAPPASAGTSGAGTDVDDAALAAVAPALRAGLQQVGDSVVVVGGADHVPDADVDDVAGVRHGLWQVHVHTDHPLEALRVLERWEVGQVVVRCLSHQVSAVSSRPDGTSASVGVVACTASPGLVMDLARSGAVVVLRGDGAVERADLLRAVHETDAEHVVVLPADEPTLALARGLEDVSRPQVTVVGSTSDLHVVAALSAWVVGGPAPADDLSAALTPLSDAVAAVRAASLDAARPAGLREALDRLLGVPDGRAADAASPTVLTVLVGDLVPGRVVDDLVSRAEDLVPGVEVVVLPSGRRSTALVIGAEQQ